MAYPKIPAQKQDRQPGLESEMQPPAEFIRDSYKGSGKLAGKVALISGGDSGIGRAAALHFAREGADVTIMYLDEHEDAATAKRMVEAEGQRCITLPGDIRDSRYCNDAVRQTIEAFSRLDVLVNNAGRQEVQTRLEDITDEQWEKTFATNIHGYFYLTRAALPHLKAGASIINTTSINSFIGNPMLVDYTATKGAIDGFTRALSQQLIERDIRVNQIAPGPIWTPLQPATIGKHDPEMLEGFGSQMPMGRCGQPSELGPAYVYLACEDSSYVSGQTIHINGGKVVNG
ncbi:SDR family oxidoreductase [Pseudomonas sp. MTM4]|uniref:SDR family oxidoreductase n=1 Tax=unclassified Pseudomonas TaxID=196821 RepID=UPI0018D2453D|nr:MULTISPECIES: SDR family oxidoreductase [unclassified Pseudomonas]MBC8650184.1 SDR family oxidoreductase [Pseudomonas sp. MT4]QXY93776.1 SDR family oxidoreductase [Pseudomonas sp. MTM4]